jgi:hypothetical protein
MRIEIRIEGGLVQDVWKSQDAKDVEVIVRDYDIEGGDEDRLSKDESGEECFESVW